MVLCEYLDRNDGSSIFLPGYLERTSVLDFVGAASSRDRFNSRLEAAPTGVFFSNLDLPDKRLKYLRCEPTLSGCFCQGAGHSLSVHSGQTS